MRVAVTLAILAASLLACASQPRTGDETITMLRHLRAEDPGDPAVLYTFARVREALGDYPGTLSWRAQLEASGFDDAIDPQDFKLSMCIACCGCRSLSRDWLARRT